MYVGATKADLETAIANDTAAATFGWVDLHKAEILSVGVYFAEGDYTASASGYTYGSTAAQALAKL